MALPGLSIGVGLLGVVRRLGRGLDLRWIEIDSFIRACHLKMGGVVLRLLCPRRRPRYLPSLARFCVPLAGPQRAGKNCMKIES